MDPITRNDVRTLIEAGGGKKISIYIPLIVSPGKPIRTRSA
jgi:hypothetical protein